MVSEVNKLIFNALVQHRAVNLPGVGTLYVLRTPSTMPSRNTITPPHYEVSFSSHKQTISIVDIISRTANVEVCQAQDIYDRWLTKVSDGCDIHIEGVGVLKGKSFVCDKALYNQFNILTPSSLQISTKRRYRGIILFYLFLLLIVCVAIAYLYLYPKEATVTTDSRVATTIIEPIPEPEVVDEIIVEPIKVAEEIEFESVESEPMPISNDWRELTDIRHRVVVGSYSTEENAKRAIAALEESYNELYFNVFRLGSMYAVAAFGSNDIAECQQFERDNKSNFAQSWIYTPRKFK